MICAIRATSQSEEGPKAPSDGPGAPLLVVAAGQTKRVDLRRAAEKLAQVNAPVVGTVLNEVTRQTGYGYGSGRFGPGMRGGSAWIGILLILLALRFLLVDSFVGAHAAIFWVLGIGGILLVARVVLFSWLRRRRFRRSPPGAHPGPSRDS